MRPHTTTRSRNHQARRWAAASTLALIAVTGAGCSAHTASNSSDAGSAVADGRAVAGDSAGLESRSSLSYADGVDFQTSDAIAGSKAKAPTSTTSEPAIISRGTVSLRSDDVEAARFAVQKLVDQRGGEVSSDDASTDDAAHGDGTLSRVRMVLRIPSADFTQTIEDLEKIGTLENSTTSSKDVTTQVLDVASRVKVQQASIRRIRVLLDRARTIRDIVTIESELSSRQADLDSLLKQQAYLASQTSMSTIKVYVEKTSEAKQKKDDDSGFVSGLRHGWHALTAATIGLLTATGVALPFAGLALILALIATPFVRRFRRAGRTARTPSDA